MISRRSLLVAGAAIPTAVYGQCVINAPAVDACLGGVRNASPAGATLDLNFMFPGSLDPRITFSRASTATYTDASGVIQTAAVNQPRWDYAGGSLRGLLIEEARTNVILNSGNAAAASWGPSGITSAPPTITANQITAPDGTLTAARMVIPAVSAAGAQSTVLPNSAGTVLTVAPYSFSVWLKGNAGGEQLYLSGTTNGVSYLSQSVTLTTTWQRFVLPFTATAVTWLMQIGTDRRDATQAATLAQTIFVWGAQMEQGAATAYIPTTSATVTRAVDVATMPTAAWYNPAVSTIESEMLVPSMPAAVAVSLQIDDNTANNRIALSLLNGSGQAIGLMSTAGTQVNSLTTAGPAAGAVFKAAAAFSTGSHVVINGGAAATAGLPGGGYPPLLSVVRIGGFGSTNVLNGYIRRVQYWPRALSDAELQQVTT